MIVASRLKPRLFIEGVEVPVVSVSWSGSIGQHARLSVQIPYSEKVIDLKPRSLCHLFVQEDDDLYFAFTGDLVSVGIARTKTSSQAVLIMVGHTNYWESAYLFNVTGLGKEGKVIANFVGSRTYVGSESSIFPGGSSSLYMRLVRTLAKRPRSFPRLKGILGGVVSLLEYVGGWYHGKRAFRGLNDFLSMAELRLKLMQQIWAVEEDGSAVMILKNLRDWAKNIIGRRGSMVSFSQLLNQLFQFVFYQWVPVYAGRYRPPKTIKKRKTFVRIKKAYTDKELVDMFKKLRDMVDQAEKFSDFRLCRLEFGRIRQAIKGRGWHKSYGLFLAANAVFVNLYAYLWDGAIADPMHPITHKMKKHYRWRQDKIVQLLDKAIASLTQTKKIRGVKEWTEEEYDRLMSALIIPELIFSPPPTCNVIFPDHITSFQLRKDFLGSPTRLMLRAESARKGDIFTGGYSKLKVYFAPDTKSIRGAVKMGSKEFARSVMPHELYTGIIPSNAQIPWSGAYKIRAKGRSDYVQRLANYIYLKERFKSRAVNIELRYHPDLIVGLPALVVVNPISKDRVLEVAKELIEPKLVAQALQDEVPDQYLGYIVSIQHNITTKGSSTSVALQYLRTHREELESLGDAEAVVRTRVGTKVVDEPSTRTIRVAVHDVIKDQRAALANHFEVVSAKKVWKLARPGDWPFITEVGGRTVLFMHGVRWPATTFSATVWEVEVKGHSSKKRVGVYKTTRRKLSFEERATPPWLDKKWHPENISDTYKSLLGVEAINGDIILDVEELGKVLIEGEDESSVEPGT